MRVTPSRRILGTGLALTALLFGTTTAALAQDSEEVGEEAAESLDDGEPLVACSSDDDFALLGELIECTAEGLAAGEVFEWEVDFFALDPALGDLEDPEELTDEEFEDLTEMVGGAGGQAEADVDGVGTFEFTVPGDLEIGLVGLFDGVVFQGEDYEEYFGGFIFGDIEFSELACTPDPAAPGDSVTCEAEDQPGADFEWAVVLLSLDDLEDFLDFMDFDEDLIGEDDDIDLDALWEELGSLDALEDAEDIADLEDLFAEGTATVGDDGVLAFGFDLPSDTTAVAYATFFVSDTSVGFFVGEITELEDDAEAGEAPVTEADDEDSASGPVTVPRPTRVEAGAGGAASGSTNNTSGLLAASGIVLLGVALVRRRRVLS